MSLFSFCVSEIPNKIPLTLILIKESQWYYQEKVLLKFNATSKKTAVVGYPRKVNDKMSLPKVEIVVYSHCRIMSENEKWVMTLYSFSNGYHASRMPAIGKQSSHNVFVLFVWDTLSRIICYYIPRSVLDCYAHKHPRIQILKSKVEQTYYKMREQYRNIFTSFLNFRVANE